MLSYQSPASLGSGAGAYSRHWWLCGLEFFRQRLRLCRCPQSKCVPEEAQAALLECPYPQLFYKWFSLFNNKELIISKHTLKKESLGRLSVVRLTNKIYDYDVVVGFQILVSSTVENQTLSISHAGMIGNLSLEVGWEFVLCTNFVVCKWQPKWNKID